ncbi:MAG: MoxR family ATPase [Gemmatimonadaceae bacterium]|nr:MoxR family ATPase [Gemmatimonadaceae bacterium]
MTTPEMPSPSADAVAALRTAIRRRIVGQDVAIDELLAALLARGHVLLEGVPGVAKTLLVRVVAAAAGVRFGRIQFTPDLMPADITGTSVLRGADGRFEFRPGPLFTDLLLADEINRAPAKTQAALLEAMQEKQVTVDGTRHDLGARFTVVATQNPVEFEGTYPLPEAQLDRFLVKVRVGYPAADDELAMLQAHARGDDPERAMAGDGFAISATAFDALRDATDRVTIAPEVVAYIAAVVRATRDDPALALGASPRAAVALLRISRAAAVLAGRDFVTPDDVKGLAPAALRHRLILSPELDVEGRTTDDVLAAVLLRVPAPA